MTALTLAAAQTVSIAGDVPANIHRHLAFMRAAAANGVQVLVFPELSLTGYEPFLAAELAIEPEAAVLAPLREMARELRLTAVVGMPVRLASQEGVLIGALVLGADGSLGVYTKQHLHPGEALAFVAGQGARPSSREMSILRWRCVRTFPTPAILVARLKRVRPCMRRVCWSAKAAMRRTALCSKAMPPSMVCWY